MALTDPLSFQLYSARRFPPLDQQLAALTRLGYTNVEPFGGLYDDADGLRAVLDRNGLTARSGHFGLGTITDEPERVIEIARTLGMLTVVAPYLGPEERPQDATGWAAIGASLARSAERYGDANLRLAWHNHDFEFVALPDGSFPIEHLLTTGVVWEADIAWVVKAGADPRPWLQRYRGRVPLVHVKDIAPAGEKADEDGWADVGQGTVPWGELWPLCVAAGAETMIAEHDNPADFERFARVSADAMRALAGGTK